MSDNRSFFEKLTGSIKLDEEAEIPTREVPKEEPKQEPEPKYEVRAAASPAPVRAKKAPRQIQIEEKPKDDSWLESESEGQLTVDIFDTGDYIVIQSAVAGVDPENLDVSFSDDMVTIRGRRERMEETREENYYYKELYWGTFSRSVILPEPVDIDRAEATLKNGILTVRLPKKSVTRAQKIKVKSI